MNVVSNPSRGIDASLATQESIEAFFLEYAKYYSRLDTTGVFGHFALPWIIFSNNEPSCWQAHESDALVAVTDSLMSYYREQGVVSFTPKVGPVLSMGPRCASVLVAWTGVREDNTEWQFHTGYHLTLKADGWKIYGVVQAD